MKVKKNYLILIAGIVWMIAGVNILRIGAQASHGIWHVVNVTIALVVFCLFFFFIFGRMVKKHTDRIRDYKEHRVWVFKFFDVQSYVIMVFMITLGITVRSFKLMPERWIAMFYVGLGSALIAAGVGFLIQFFRVGTAEIKV
ncbi:MAG: hypothetical protein JJE36_06080 [Coriobacteriia bacterium]|nr:hypothetical protein [Coriobacteriia bacterium]